MENTQNDAPFFMRDVIFVLPDEMADVSIAELQWFILIPQLNHTGSHKPSDSRSKPYLHQRKKCKIWSKNHQPAAILQIQRKEVVGFVF